MKEDPILNLEEALKKLWQELGRSQPIPGVHTEVIIEPKFFLGRELNPEIADLLISVYLSKTTLKDVESGRVTLQNEVILINDEQGHPIAEIRNQRMIKEFADRLGF